LIIGGSSYIGGCVAADSIVYAPGLTTNYNSPVLPGGSTRSDYISGVGIGNVGTYNTLQPAGGNGAIVLTFSDSYAVTWAPTTVPTAISTAAPSSTITTAPSPGPTASTSSGPSAAPSSGPSAAPSSGPSAAPSSGPSAAPSSSPSIHADVSE